MQKTKTPNPVDVAVGRKVRLFRLMRNMSQEALAAPLGITFQQVQKYEKGTNRVSASRLQHLADVLGTPVSTFFDDGSSKRNVPPHDQDFASTRQGAELSSAFVRIKSPALRRRIIDVIETLAGDR